jgi:hypothetical protein
MTHTEHDVGTMPPDTLRTLHHVYEIICRIWDHDPRHSRSYPDPMRRIPQILGLGPQPGEATWFRPESMAVAHDRDRDGRAWYVVLAVDGEHVPDWEEGVERTYTPIRRIWGPGSWWELKAHYAESASSWPHDEVMTLDRVFFVRVVRGAVEVPRTAGQVRELQDRDAAERWLVIKADGPGDVLGHVRAWLGMRPEREKPCPDQGWCESCAVEVMVPLSKRHTIDRFVRRGLAASQGPRLSVRGPRLDSDVPAR